MDRWTEIVVSAPGKVILHGEHAVVYGKTALAVSLNLRTFVRLKETNQLEVILDLPDIELRKSWTIEEISSILDGFSPGELCTPVPVTDELLSKLKNLANIPEDELNLKNLAVISFLYIYLAIMSHKRKDGLQSLSVEVTSNLPTGAGLGSSAAYSVSLAAALLTYSGAVKPINDASDDMYMKWTTQHLVLINKWGYEAERIIHGTPSGIDNSVSTYGGAINFKRLQDKDGIVSPHITSLERVPLLRILLVNTRVARITKLLVEKCRKKLEQYPDIIGPILDSIDAIAIHCQTLFNDVQSKDYIYQEMEELIDMNQHLLAVLGVSHPALQQVIQITSKYGLHSKLTGAGGGGCALTLVRPDTPPSTLLEIKKELSSLDMDCWETSIGGRGVTIHRDIHSEALNTTTTNFTIPTSFTQQL